MTSLDTHLSRSARSYATRALTTYVEERDADFAFFAGISIEHAVKAKLARINPAFVAPDRQGLSAFKAAVALHQHSSNVDELPTGTPTVGAWAAVDRLSSLEPKLRGMLEPTKELLALRNGQAHLGHGNPTQRRRLFVVFLRVIDALLQIDPEAFWAPHYDMVRTTLDERSAELVREIAERITSARLTFERRFGSLDDVQRQALLVIAHDRHIDRLDEEDALAVSCPACGSSAIAEGETEATSRDPISGYPELTFFADSVSCEPCGLRLNSVDEIQAAGMAGAWDNDTIDIDDWLAAHESEPWDDTPYK